jgi:uncharacterized protein (DUF983 family)
MPDPIGPYEALEPGTVPSAPAGAAEGRTEPGGVTAFARGIARRCPRCGSGQLFERWFTIREACPRCSLRLQREEGGFLGAMTINYTVTAAVWLVVFVTWLVLDLPEVHVAALMFVSLAIAGLVPLLFFPFAKTSWAAVDYLVYRSSPEYERDRERPSAGAS